MTFEDLKTTIYRLEKIMYGHNYEVTYGMDIFENCPTIEEFSKHLKTAYPNSRPENVTLIPITLNDFWEEINFGLAYRGDNNAGLKLNKKEQEKFDNLQKEYKDFICQHINDTSNFYSYPDETGIPGYPVFGTTDLLSNLRQANFYLFMLRHLTENAIFIKDLE